MATAMTLDEITGGVVDAAFGLHKGLGLACWNRNIERVLARDLHGSRVKTVIRPLVADDRARTDGVTSGFVKLVYLENGKLLGASLVAPRAAEMLQEWIIALERGLKVGDLADVIHVYPGYALSNQQAAYQIRLQLLLKGRFGGIIRRLAGGK